GAAGTGQLSVTLTAPTVNPANYNFEWFEGPTTSSPVLGTATSGVEAGVNGEIAQNLETGIYTVRVTKIAGGSAGCSTTATYQIFENAPVMTVATADVTIVNITRCDQIAA